MIEAKLALIGSIAVVSMLTCYALLYSLSDSKTVQLNSEHYLICQLILSEFNLSNYAAEVS